MLCFGFDRCDATNSVFLFHVEARQGLSQTVCVPQPEVGSLSIFCVFGMTHDLGF